MTSYYQREVKVWRPSVTRKIKCLGVTDEYPPTNSNPNPNPKHLKSQRVHKGRRRLLHEY